MTGMDISILSSFPTHDDPDASLAFYRDTLVFEVRNDVEFGGVHWAEMMASGTYASLSR